MRIPLALLTLLALLGLSPPLLYAGTLAGVTLPERTQADEQPLVLNGMGVRSKWFVKVYVAGLYLPRRSSDASAILAADEPKRVVMHFVRDVSREQMVEAFDESFGANAPQAKQTMQADVDRFLHALAPVDDGHEMAVTYVPGTGTTLTIDGREAVTIAAPAFARAIFSAWLGPDPPSEDLKQGLLGSS